MKRYVARGTAGDGMTHWYVYFDGYTWQPDITKAVFYESDNEALVRESYYSTHRKDIGAGFTMVGVSITIKEEA